MAQDYDLRPFTVAEYHRVAEAGILEADERVELLDGLLVRMSPIGERHWMLHAQAVPYLIAALPAHAVIGRGSFALGGSSEPQPDLAILARPLETFWARPSTPADLIAVVEIADTSLRKDTGLKLRLYAQAGIPDYLVVDVAQNVLLHHTSPHERTYARTDTLRHGATFELQRVPGTPLAAERFLIPV